VSSGNAKELASNFDNTPPPGEWIYEKQMRRKTVSEPMEWWEPEWTGQEFAQCNTRLLAVRQRLYDLVSSVGVFRIEYPRGGDVRTDDFWYWFSRLKSEKEQFLSILEDSLSHYQSQIRKGSTNPHDYESSKHFTQLIHFCHQWKPFTDLIQPEDYEWIRQLKIDGNLIPQHAFHQSTHEPERET